MAVGSCDNEYYPLIDTLNVYGNKSEFKKVKELRKSLFQSGCSCRVGIFCDKNCKVSERRKIRI